MELPDRLHEECGVVGVYAPAGGAVQITYAAILALQHRGQKGAGVSFVEAATNSQAARIEVVKGLGRIASVFDNGELLAQYEEPQFASAHTRYSTSVTVDQFAALQPLHVAAAHGAVDLTVSHNGNLDRDNILALAEEYGVEPRGTDSMTFSSILGAATGRHGHIEPAMREVLPKVENGAFTLIIMTKGTLYAVKDRQNIRPLQLGVARGTGAIVVASEVGALTAANATHEKEVSPGTYLAINRRGIREERWGEADPHPCVFESLYFSMPDNDHNGVNTGDFRYRAGALLAAVAPVEADAVIPVLGTGEWYARGYADASGTPYAEGLKKNPGRHNPDSDRTFIEPTQAAREAAVREKLLANPDIVRGKKVVVVDDTIVRGTTMPVIVEMLREAGAIEVHVRVPSPRIVSTCHLGVDISNKEGLLAHGRSTEAIRRVIGADSLAYLSLEQTQAVLGPVGKIACMGCMGGNYPPPLKQHVAGLATSGGVLTLAKV